MKADPKVHTVSPSPRFYQFILLLDLHHRTCCHASCTCRHFGSSRRCQSPRSPKALCKIMTQTLSTLIHHGLMIMKTGKLFPTITATGAVTVWTSKSGSRTLVAALCYVGLASAGVNVAANHHRRPPCSEPAPKYTT